MHLPPSAGLFNYSGSTIGDKYIIEGEWQHRRPFLDGQSRAPTHHAERLGFEPGRRLLEIDEDRRLFRTNPDDPEPGLAIWPDQITHAVEFDILP